MWNPRLYSCADRSAISWCDCILRVTVRHLLYRLCSPKFAWHARYSLVIWDKSLWIHAVPLKCRSAHEHDVLLSLSSLSNISGGVTIKGFNDGFIAFPVDFKITFVKKTDYPFFSPCGYLHEAFWYIQGVGKSSGFLYVGVSTSLADFFFFGQWSIPYVWLIGLLTLSAWPDVV